MSVNAEDRPLTEWEQGLMRALQARTPGVVIATLEEERAFVSLLNVAKALAQIRCGTRTVHRWSAASNWKFSLVNEQKPLELSATGGNVPPEKKIKDWLEEKDDDGKLTDSILVLADVEPLLERSYGLVRLLRETLSTIKTREQRKTIVLLNKEFRLPDELRPHLMRFALDLPDVDYLIKLTQYLIGEVKKYPGLENLSPSPELVRAYATACSGLTDVEVRTLFSLGIAKFKTMDDRSVALAQREKARILLAGGALAMQEPRVGFEDVGGLQHAKAWAEQISPIVADPAEAKAFGLKIPSGLLLIGTPGCGKSLLAEALAKHWRLPLLRFDVGSCFGSLVGESEKNIRRMIEMAHACKPCVVFVDEIEKGLGGDSLDGGTTSRVKQALLTWLQDKPESVFVVATANDLTRLNSMPELIRSGRFDQKFFVDLPDSAAREEIFKIHFHRTGHEIDRDTLREAALATAKYSGAEIEVIVQQALRFAFANKPRGNPTKGQILKAVTEIKPLAETMVESIARLRAWCHDGRAKLAGGTLEQEAVAEARKGQPPSQDVLSDLAN